MTSHPIVEVSDVVKVYAGRRSVAASRPAVDRVSFTIEAGTTFGLVGESGSGKSTIARMLLRLEPPTSGRVHFDGADVWQLSGRSLRELRRRMQIVLQDPINALNRRQSVEQIVSAPMKVHRLHDRRGRRRRVYEVLEMVGLSATHARQYPSALSGGQCQRVCIARALALSPQLIVLDEAVSALDVSIRAQILNLLREIQDATGVAYLFVSHDLAVVRYMAPRLAVMQAGRIVEAGSRDEIFARPQSDYTKTLLAAIPAPDPADPFPMRHLAPVR